MSLLIYHATVTMPTGWLAVGGLLSPVPPGHKPNGWTLGTSVLQSQWVKMASPPSYSQGWHTSAEGGTTDLAAPMEMASGVRQHHVSKLHLQPPLGWVCITTTECLGCGSIRLVVAQFIVNGSCLKGDFVDWWIWNSSVKGTWLALISVAVWNGWFSGSCWD